MPGGLAGDPVSRMLQYALNGLSKRQNVIANNIANVDTPGFKSSRVDFESQLKAAMSRERPLALLVTHPKHVQIEGLGGLNEPPKVVTAGNRETRVDRSDVDVEREMFQLADTTIRYQTMTRAVTERLGWLRSVISGGLR